MTSPIRSGDYFVVRGGSRLWYVSQGGLGYEAVVTGNGGAAVRSRRTGRTLQPHGERSVDVIRAVRRIDPIARAAIIDHAYRLPGEVTRPAASKTTGVPAELEHDDQWCDTHDCEFEDGFGRSIDTSSLDSAEFRDRVSADEVDYHLLTDTTYANAPYSVRIQVGRDLTADEARQLAALAGYAYAKTGGERGNGFSQDTPRSIVFYCDTTKGRAYKHLDEFFEDLRGYIKDGSPQRKTKGGTRLIQGLGDVGRVEFYADSVAG